jgi:hypothetical protein
MLETHLIDFLKVLKELQDSPSEFKQAQILIREAVAGSTAILDLLYLKYKCKRFLRLQKKDSKFEIFNKLVLLIKQIFVYVREVDKVLHGSLLKVFKWISHPRMGGPLLNSIETKRMKENFTTTQLISYLVHVIRAVFRKECKNIALQAEDMPFRRLGNKIPRLYGQFHRIVVLNEPLKYDLISSLIPSIRHVKLLIGNLMIEYSFNPLTNRIELLSEIDYSCSSEIIETYERTAITGTWYYEDLEEIFKNLESFADQEYDSFNHNCQHFVAIFLNSFGNQGRKLLKEVTFISIPLLDDAPYFKQVNANVKDYSLEIFNTELPSYDLEDSCLEELFEQMEAKLYIQNHRRELLRPLDRAYIDFINMIPFKRINPEEKDFEMLDFNIYKDSEKPLRHFEPSEALLEKGEKVFDEILTLHMSSKKKSRKLCTKEEYVFEAEDFIPLFEREKIGRKAKSIKTFIKNVKSFTTTSLEHAAEQLYYILKPVANCVFELERYLVNVEKHLTERGMYLRRTKKVVWAPYFDELRIKLSKVQQDHSEIFKEETKAILFENPEDNLKLQCEKMAQFYEIPEYMMYSAYRRYINHNPLTDLKLERVAEEMHLDFQFPVGVGSNVFASVATMYASTRRYFKENKVLNFSPEYVDELAECMIEMFPGSLANAKLVSYFKVMKSVNKRFSSSIPHMFDPETKTKGQLWAKLGKAKINEYLMKEAASGFVYENIHHVFPKICVLKLEKILNDPASFRTIIAQYFVGYAHMMTFSYHVNKRDHYNFLPAQIRLPMAGGFLSMLAKKHGAYKHTFATDMSKWDSSLPDQIIDIVKRIRQLGFKNHYNYPKIASFIAANYEALKQGTLFDTISGKVWKKWCGLTTGHANTTMDNSLSLIAAYLIAWHELTGRPFGDFFKWNLLSCYGDDNIFSTNLITEAWNPKNICKYLSEKLGIEMRVEAQGKITDVSFLAKTFVKGEIYMDEFLEANVPIPEYAVVHDLERLLTNFTTLKMKRNTPIWMYQRAMGYLLNTCHHHSVYCKIAKYMEEMKPGILAHNGGARFLKKFPILTYEQVLRINYMTKHERLSNITKSYGWTIEDSLKYAYNSVGYYEYFIDTALDLTKGFARICYDNGLNSCEADLFYLAKPNIYTDDFAVESFVYLANKMPSDYSTYSALLSKCPWYLTCRPTEFWEKKMPELRQDDLEHYRNRVLMLTIIYITLHRGLSNLCRLPILGIAAKIFSLSAFEAPHIYANLGYLHWLETGTSSDTLSSIMPMDAWLNHKKAAIFVLNRIPFTIPLPIEWITKKTKILTQAFISIIAIKYKAEHLFANAFIEFQDYNMDLDFENPWDLEVEEIVALVEKETKLVVKAVTAAGKTSLLPRSLAKHFDTIWLLFPRRCLVEQVNLPSCVKNHGLNKNPIQGQKFVACTYGWFNANKPCIGLNDLIFYDEFHEMDVDMLPILETYSMFKSIYSSATPIDVVKAKVYTSPIKRRFQIIEHSIEGGDIARAFLKVKEQHPGEYILCIYPDMKFNNKLKKSLEAYFPGEKFSLFDSQHPQVIEDSHIIATSIVDAGMDIKHINVVLNTGVERTIVNGHSALRQCREFYMIQRNGRVGRHRTGHAYVMKGLSNLPPSEPDIDIVKYINNPEVYDKYLHYKGHQFHFKNFNEKIPQVYDFSHYPLEARYSIEIFLQVYYSSNRQMANIKKEYNALRRGETRPYFDIQAPLLSFESIVDLIEENHFYIEYKGVVRQFDVLKFYNKEVVLDFVAFG